MFDHEKYSDMLSLGRPLPNWSGMYGGGLIVPTEWPQLADPSTYEAYARLPSLHVEEAASLFAGFVPRDRLSLNFRPVHDMPKTPPPYEGAKTWGMLISEREAIGRIISLYARDQRVQGWSFSGRSLHTRPTEFLEFCDRYEVPVPDDLRRTVQGLPRHKRSVKHQSKVVRVPKKEHYKSHVVPVLQDMKSAKVHLTRDHLQTFVESRFEDRDKKIAGRTFQDYLADWRQDTSLRELLSAVLLEAAGRPSEEYEDELKKKLPDRYRHVLFPAWRPTKKSRK